MVYLLHAYFGRDGREEADMLLERQSGDDDKPRILDAFNQPCSDWLTFFCFATFADRDGKYQLGALAESAFDPLSRTCRFMLIEEAHHLSVGQKGISRILQRAVQLEKADPNGDVRNQGGIDLQTIQKYINYWFSYCFRSLRFRDLKQCSRVLCIWLEGTLERSRRTMKITVPSDKPSA